MGCSGSKAVPAPRAETREEVPRAEPSVDAALTEPMEAARTEPMEVAEAVAVETTDAEKELKVEVTEATDAKRSDEEETTTLPKDDSVHGDDRVEGQRDVPLCGFCW